MKREMEMEMERGGSNYLRRVLEEKGFMIGATFRKNQQIELAARKNYAAGLVPGAPSLGSYSLWSVGIVLSCFLGLAIGFATRPYIIRHEEANHHHSFHHDMEASPNYQISNLEPPLSLEPSDDVMDLITFDDAQETNNDEECSDQETDIALTLPRATIDDMINVQIQRWLRTALQLFLR
ncbi:hypothetical protein F2Q69_00054408 [Brassica cretica]|uniref:Uncharacterized protein n=1 Tax=Brassica cretica TaxID=69181 RepID=A0A8S9MW74_BRACR|nr:hypothetical protein F2Q69_00054408 [Brassica cretica]